MLPSARFFASTSARQDRRAGGSIRSKLLHRQYVQNRTRESSCRQLALYNLLNTMPNAGELQEYYQSLTDDELLKLKSEGGFTEEAKEVLSNELALRKLAPCDVKRYVDETGRNKLHEDVRERGGGYRMPGLQFFGRRYLNDADKEANIQIRTKWFTMSGIPLIPLASYRFKCTSNPGKWFRAKSQQEVIDRVPLDWVQVFMTWGKTAVLFIAVGLLIVGIAEGKRALEW